MGILRTLAVFGAILALSGCGGSSSSTTAGAGPSTGASEVPVSAFSGSDGHSRWTRFTSTVCAAVDHGATTRLGAHPTSVDLLTYLSAQRTALLRLQVSLRHLPVPASAHAALRQLFADLVQLERAYATTDRRPSVTAARVRAAEMLLSSRAAMLGLGTCVPTAA